ncbi:hypothetical protein MFM001_48090 [Mycobacterium sp. MFM001]|uniref:hypothetical protein n=1 Tax=Mycobacterium sp. MFM001 TaxID=2049453 RepID=UPI000DA510D1|nr:hypothetical protein [Mycobacterium sp. MFM001]GBE68347.1 hypothetical protein MFM001_48090 [Mycobacterium sp. MFM001]
MPIDEFSLRYSDLVTGSYDCVDRIVLNAFYPLGYHPGGLRTWWRRLHGDSDAELDNTHLMRMAGRFARRVKAWGAANGVPVIFCKAGERKHRIAEEYLATHEVGIGVFLVLVAKAPAPVWKVARSVKTGAIVNIERRREYVNHYSFHIIDPEWGHVTIKMSGHPPFGAQIMLNGHEYVARQATAAGIAFHKLGNCFTGIADPAGLARIADALSQDAAVGRLGQVCQRWIYTACLCFGLDLDEQQRSGFGYGFAVYQLEYSRNLIFSDGARMQRVFDTVVDRTRSRLDVPKIRTIFGAARRPYRTRKRSSVIEAAIETPTYDLTVFKLNFGRLTGKAYTKGERVLRFEAIAHNTADLRCGRMIEKFPQIVTQLAGIAERFATALDCVDTGFLDDGILDELPAGSTLGASRVGGVDLNKPRMHEALRAALALAPAPNGFTVAEFAAKVHALTGVDHSGYSVRQAAYDLRKLRGKQLVDKPGRSRRYRVPPLAARTIAALLTLRDQVIAPILAGVHSPKMGRKPTHWTTVDRDYERIRIEMQTLFTDLAIETPLAA